MERYLPSLLRGVLLPTIFLSGFLPLLLRKVLLVQVVGHFSEVLQDHVDGEINGFLTTAINRPQSRSLLKINRFPKPIPDHPEKLIKEIDQNLG